MESVKDPINNEQNEMESVKDPINNEQNDLP